MSYGVSFLGFRNGQPCPVPLDNILNLLAGHGCRVPELQQGSNEVGLPLDQNGYSAIGEFAALSVEGDSTTAFGLHRPQATAECTALLFSLINELNLVMLPDHGSDLYARADVVAELPEEMLNHFSNVVIVRNPDDCL